MRKNCKFLLSMVICQLNTVSAVCLITALDREYDQRYDYGQD